MNPISYWQRLKVAFQYVMPQIYMTQAKMGRNDTFCD